MASQLVHILMMIGVVCCPVLCKAGSVAAADGAQPRAAAGCCHAKSLGGESEGPADSSRQPQEGGCQCLCGGAIVAAAVVLDLDCDGCWGESPDAAFAQGVALGASGFAHAATFLPPDPPGANVGRALRCLLSSLLC